MMKSNITPTRTYAAPVTSVVTIEQERNFTATGEIQDMDYNNILDEDF